MIMNNLTFIFYIRLFVYLNLAIILLIAFFKYYKFIKLYFTILHINSLRKESSSFVEEKGVNISISGLMRSGKNTLANYIINEKEKINMNECYEKMNHIKVSLYYIDFNKINNIIDDYFEKNGVLSYKDLTLLVGKIFTDLKYANGLYNNYIGNYEIKDMMLDYCVCYYVLNIRGFNILSKTYMYSWNTGSVAHYLTDDTLNIKEVPITNNFYLEPYMILFQDEKSLTKGNIKSTNLKEKDKGYKELCCLMGNAFKETLTSITLKQVANDDMAQDRRLYTDNILIMSNEKSNPYWDFCMPIIEKMIDKLDRKYQRIYNKKIVIDDDFSKAYPSYFDYIEDIDICDYKKNLSELEALKDYVKSLGYITINTRNYKKSDDIGKNDESTFAEESYVMPIKLVWGNYDTHEYKIALDYLYKYSDKKAMNIKKNSFFKDNVDKDIMLKFLFDRVENETIDVNVKVKKNKSKDDIF